MRLFGDADRERGFCALAFAASLLLLRLLEDDEDELELEERELPLDDELLSLPELLLLPDDERELEPDELSLLLLPLLDDALRRFLSLSLPLSFFSAGFFVVAAVAALRVESVRFRLVLRLRAMDNNFHNEQTPRTTL